MRLSATLGSTLREAPAGVEAPGHQLLLRAGYVRQVGQGIFSLLPLGRRTTDRIEQILRDEMTAIGGVEVSMPLLLPAELWRRSGRLHTVGPELTRLRDRRGRELLLAMTHEEVAASLAASEITSYRQLPLLVFQIQTKWRDDPRPRAGLVRAREFTMKDSYSFDRDEEGLDRQYEAHDRAYRRIFARCGVPALAVGADVGVMGGLGAHEYMYRTPLGEDTLVLCDGCGYAQNRQVARSAKAAAAAEDPLPLTRVPTPGATTIEVLADQLAIDAARTAKVVFLVVERRRADGTRGTEPVVAVVRGDCTLNESKLATTLGLAELRPMTDEEIESIGAVAGYASPIGLHGATVVADALVMASPNLVGGANEEGWHLLHTNAGRDWVPHVVAEIATADDGDACVVCGAALRTERGIEIGNIFKLGTRYAEAMEATYLDADGRPRPVVMGSYGIGVGRLLACAAEEHRDERGLCWPPSLAPFAVHLLALPGDGVVTHATRAYDALGAAGLDVLYDDRGERPGVQFADADLIGLPLRATVSRRSLGAGGVEVAARLGGDAEVVAVEALADHVARRLGDLTSPPGPS
jgi:prolyl-tRNA synthetase